MVGLTDALRFLITSDSAQARTDLAKLNQQTGSTMSSLEKLQGSFKTGLGVGAGVSVFDTALQGLGQVGRFALSQASAAIDASSRLQQSQGAVKAIFGESAAQVERFGRSAADAVGLSNSAFQQQAAVLGALLQNLGQTRAQSAATSRDLIQTGADLAATFGTTTADAVAAIGSALRGERDPIERYGISIKEASVAQKALQMGLADSASKLTDAQKATATLALIQDQAASSAGAFGRESDTLAGQQQRLNAEMENLRAELGDALLPAMTELVGLARDIAPAMRFAAIGVEGAAQAFGAGTKIVAGFAKPIRDTERALAPFVRIAAAATGVADGLFGGSNSALLDGIETSMDLADAVESGNISLAEARIQLESIPPAARGMAEAAIKAAEANVNLRSVVDQTVDALRRMAGAMSDNIFGTDTKESAFFKSLETGSSSAGKSAKQLEKSLRGVDSATRNLADAQAALQEAEVQRFLTSLGATADEITLAQIAERDSTRGLADAKRDLIDAQERLQKLREVDQASLLDAEAANIEAQRALVDAQRTGDAVALKRAQADLLRTEEALAKARDPGTVDEIAQAEQDVAAAQDSVTKAEIAAKTSRQELNDLINRGRDGSKELADANKSVENAQRRVSDAELALADAQDGLNDSMSGLGGTTKDAGEQFRIAQGKANEWLQDLIAKKKTPEEFAAAVAAVRDRLGEVAEKAGQREELNKWLDSLDYIYGRINDIETKSQGVLGSLKNVVGLSGGIGASVGVPQTVELNVDGRTFGEIVVNSLINWSNNNGALPIVTR